jgi:hypothetical protein
VRFRGKADRVDRDDEGGLHIVDYKTGGTRGYTDFNQADPDQQGRHLQLPVYGVAARQHVADPHAPVVAEYWFVSSKGEFKRKPLAITGEVLDRVGHTLQTIVDGIEAGLFPAHPTAASSTPFIECHACDPDGLGVTDLRARWDRKRLDPDLALYAQLAEPLEEADA